MHAAAAAAPQEVGEPAARPGPRAAPRLAAQLQRDLVDLREAGRAGGMAARDEPAVGVHRKAAAQLGGALLDPFLALALGAEGQQLVVLELLVGEGVVAERHAHVRGPGPGLLVGLPRRVSRHARRTDDRSDEGVPRRVTLALQRRRAPPAD